MAEDIAQYAIERMENHVPFSEQATEELEQLWKHAHRTYTLAIRAFQGGNREQAREVCRLEAEFDRMYWHTRQLHIERIEKGVCHPKAEVIFTETLRNLERISDHADNLGVSVVRN
jgi:phosphate:Na+ symporter